MSLKPALLAEARRLGFDLAGVTSPQAPPHWPVYAAWLEAGRHGEMAYLATERARQARRDPALLLPGCRSILVLAMRYAPAMSASHAPSAPPAPPADDDSLDGRLASYAWGRDYHEVLAEKLAALSAFIQRAAGRPVAARGYTDTGPLLERDLAQRAGLGWIGKNTCLIHPQIGSYFFLAELLLDLELEPDAPFTADRCGSCTRCLEACPTACILPDRTLDARRCISYLTIELKGALPAGLRPALGGWVFGCDICQQVCPWNRRAAAPPLEADFAARPGVARPHLPAELGLTPEAFNRKFKGSPVQRPRRRGYLRNVAVALGNSAHPQAAAALTTALEDAEPLVRAHAAWGLGRLGAGRAALRRALEREADPLVQAELRAALDSVQGDA